MKLTCDALRNVTLLLPQLNSLDLEQCPDMDDEQLVDLVRLRPHLCLTDYYGQKVSGT